MLQINRNILISFVIFLFTLVWLLFFLNKEIFTLEFLFLNLDKLINFINQNTYFSFFLFILSYLILVVCNFPAASLLSLTGGFLFGTWLGGIGIIVGGTLGSFFVFLLAKFFFLDFIHKKILKKYNRIQIYFKSNDIELMMMIRLIPGIPFFAQNLILAGLGANNLKFFITTLLGVAPWAFIFASIGEGLDEIFYHQNQFLFQYVFQLKFILPILTIITLIFLKLIFKRRIN